MTAAHAAVTLARRGLLTPGAPQRIAAQLLALRRWGYGLGGSLLSAAARSPAAVALIDPDGTLSYADLRRLSFGLARALRSEHGIGPGDRVGVLCRNHRGFVQSVAALSLLGADAVLINTAFAAEQVAAVVRDHGLRLVVHDPEFTVPPPAVVSSTLGSLTGGPIDPPARPGRTVVLTSGTTGVPKGARRPNPPGLSPLVSILDRIPVRARSRVQIAAPLFHTWGYAALQLAVGLRATVVLSPRFTPGQYGCDALFAVPVMLERVLEAGCALPGVNVVAVSGSALPGDLATRFMDAHGDVLYNLYGSTEVSWASVATPAELRRSPATAGRPPHGTRTVILSPTGAEVPPGVVGRIFVGNDMLFEGYSGDLPVESRDGLLATGDLGFLDEDGLLTVSGREDDMVISGGENVFPSSVEDLLAALPAVREVAVVGVPDAEFGQRLAAFVVPHPGSALSAEEVRDHVRRHGARFAVPRDVHFVASLPRTATGKVIKRALG
ncbi:AMP-binding protein [Asanoa sp. NPDC050611]|uniref:AMP-binding protein n=1 Tax=Asanoa sp. NPDC050611 TaxID=3157098 RepID=UPI003408B552